MPSIFDDLEIEVDGDVVPPAQIAAQVEDGEWDLRGAVSWPVVVRWCKEHPGHGRFFEGIYTTAPTNLRKRYPEMTVKTRNWRRKATSKTQIVDMIVYYVPPDGDDPADIVAGVPVAITRT